VVFGGNQTVNVAGNHNINLNAKVGDITGLTNVTLDAPDFAKKGRAATEEQLNIVNNGFNNTVGLTGNTGATELQKLNKQGGLSFGVVGANNGEYIKTTASGSNVVADLSDSAKNKLNSTVVVEGKNAAKVTSNVIQNADGSTKTVYTVDVNNVKPTAASTEKVQAKEDVAGSSDKNIAKVSPKAGENFGDAGATYEVNVSRNDVKDAAREAVTVNTTNTTNNPITVTPVQDEANHNTNYQVTFDGEKAAKQIPLTYKANGTNEQKVTLDKGLNFTNGKNTTASVDAEGVVKYDVNKDLVNINSISNTTNGPKMEFGPNSINITNGPINMGDQNITNLKSGGDVVNNAANIGDVTRISKANDLHIAPTTSNRTGETTTSYAYDAASKSVTLKYNDGNGATQSGTVAKIDLSGLADQIKDGYSFSTDAKGNVVGNHAVTAVGNGKTVSYAAGDNLTVKQDIDAQTGEHTYTYALSNNIDLTPNGSLKIGDTILNNGGLTITGGPSVTKTGINAGNLNITNVKAGVNDTDAVNVKQLKDARTVVTSNDNSVTVNKTENGNQVTYDLHVAPGAAQSVWNVKSTGNTTADSATTAKTITDGKTVEMAAGKNLTVKQSNTEDGAKVEFGLAGDLTNIKTIKNEGPATFTIGGNEFKFDGGNVNMGDNNITNLKSGGDVINNAANIGDVKRISKANDIHIKDKTYTVNADKTVTLEYVDGNDNAVSKTAKIDLSNLPTGDKAAVESVVKKSAAAGDTNIADITVADGKQTGDANAKYEVNVSRNAVKDAAREAVTVNTTNTTNNPITVTPVQDEANHNTTYQVTFDGDKAAKQIPLTYKANGSNDQKVTLDKGLNFTNGSNTTASVAADGVVKYDL
ncbi:MAG: Tat pathway signal protein, partial [Veillonella sp.]|nr:Tat pathway signal protein [Veillonella sp.]